jgi:hypothetical protein
MYDKLLQQISEKMKRFADAPQPPGRSESLETLKQKAIEELRHPIPDGYAAFLSKNDGFFWNGLVIYASERQPLVATPDGFVPGFVEENLGYRDFELMKDYLIFAEDGVVFYTYHVSVNSYDTVLRIGLTVLESFDSIDQLIASALKAIA